MCDLYSSHTSNDDLSAINGLNYIMYPCDKTKDQSDVYDDDYVNTNNLSKATDYYDAIFSELNTADSTLQQKISELVFTTKQDKIKWNFF